MSLRSVAFRVLLGATIGVAAPLSALAQTPPPPAAKPETPAPAAPAAKPETPAQPADPFAEEITLPAKPILFVRGSGNWDNAFETLTNSFKTLKSFLDKQKLKADGPQMTIYTATDDTGFQFQAAVPVAEPPKSLPRNIAAGKSPDGKALKFVHRGSYDSMDNTYEAITNYLDEKRLDAKDLFIEEYVTDPLSTPEDKLVINVFVPIN
jgi:effector-binding domain-containing protein